MMKNALKETAQWLRENDGDDDRFLHGYEHGEPHDEEGGMVKRRLDRMKEMAEMLCGVLDSDDQLPAWVQDHIAVAHENLQQVFSYMEPEHSGKEDHDHEEEEEDDDDDLNDEDDEEEKEEE